MTQKAARTTQGEHQKKKLKNKIVRIYLELKEQGCMQPMSKIRYASLLFAIFLHRYAVEDQLKN
jgi:hypothetical protein